MTNFNQSQAVSHPFRIIEMKQSDSSATTGGHTFNTRPVQAKMTMPFLGSWVKEKDNLDDAGSMEARSEPLKRL